MTLSEARAPVSERHSLADLVVRLDGASGIARIAIAALIARVQRGRERRGILPAIEGL